MNMKFWAAGFILLAMALAIGCDSSDSDDSTTPSDKTKVTGKVVDRWEMAQVCLDVTMDGSCQDETRYVDFTGSDGNFDLGEIPNQVIEDYQIVAVQDQTGLKMTAPGFITIYEDANPLHMSPLLTLITQGADYYEMPFGVAYKHALSLIGVNGSVNIAAIDYVSDYDKDQSFQAISLINHYIVSDPLYAEITSESSLKRSSEKEMDYAAYLQSAGNQTVQEMGISLTESVNVDKVADYAGTKARRDGYFNAITPKPDPEREGEYQKALDAADMSNAVREIVIESAGMIPKVGLFLNIFLDFAWPQEVPDLLGLLYQDVEQLIQHHLDKFRYNMVITNLRTLHATLKEAANATDDDLKRAKYLKAWDDSGYIVDNIVDDHEYNFKLLNLGVLALNSRMVLNKELLRNYDFFYPEGKPSKEALLENMIKDYIKYRDLFLNNGENSIYKRYLNFRYSLIESSAWDGEGGFMGGTTYHNGRVYDPLSGFKYTACTARSANFEHTVNNISHRLRQQIQLDMAKSISSLFVLCRFIPEGAYPQYDLKPSELLGENGYYIPNDLIHIEVGPVNDTCLVYKGEDEHLIYQQNTYCEALVSMRTFAYFSSPIQKLTTWINKKDNNSAYFLQLGLTSAKEGTKVIGTMAKVPPEEYGIEEFEPMEGLDLIGMTNIGYSHAQVNITPMGQIQVSGSNGKFRSFSAHYGRKETKTKKEIHFQKEMTAKSYGGGVKHSVVGSTDFKMTGISAAPHAYGSYPEQNPTRYSWLIFSFFPEKDTMAQKE